MPEQSLSGGNTSGAVVRVGNTVRKPWLASTPGVHAFMAAVRKAGVAVPAVLEADEAGRQVLVFAPGRSALESGPLTEPQLTQVGGMVRPIHDASENLNSPNSAMWNVAIPAPEEGLICHNDLAPWNLIVGARWTFIDWDAAGPSSRLWDLAYAAQAFTLSDPDQEPEESGVRLAAFVAGYGASHQLRQDLPAAMYRRAAAMYELLSSSHAAGSEPRSSMFSEGHGDHWHRVTEYAREYEEVWVSALAS
jgi:Ser/Thr protein kinase RdoA (MazF antagonist)